jgi:hypothetical protein
VRRLASTTTVLVALLLATVASAPGVSAQDTADHPAVGAWIIELSPGEEPPELVTIGPGGIIVNAGPEGAGYGAWAATGDRTADATFLFPLVDPEAGFLGYATVRTSIEVAEDGQSFAGTYTFEVPPELAEAFGAPVGQLGPGEVTGQRIAVEPMGEPVAPIPEFPEEQPAGESPAPGASPVVIELSPPPGTLPIPRVSPQESPAA